MNIARTLTFRSHNLGRNFIRKFRFTACNYDSSQAPQPDLPQEKFDFEDLKVHERVERRKASIPPFMKDVFVSNFNKELLAYPEILNKEETEALNSRVSALDQVFTDPKQTVQDRKNALKLSKLFAAPVSLTHNGLASNFTESIRYLETVSTDLPLSQQLSDHWVGLEALKHGLHSEQYQQLIDDLTTGDNTITLCIKEKISERLSQADFRTTASLDGQGIWHITGEKVCSRPNGYLLVLCILEANQLGAFLVHPGADGITHNDKYVTFLNTPATQLEHVSAQQLAKILGASRLHAASICRCLLTRAVNACMEYVHSRVLNGKPLSNLPSIQATFGEVLLNIYASESVEYFTAGLLDGYQDPDAEIEMAMCRNFITREGMSSLLKLLAIPALEWSDQSAQLLDEMRTLVLKGETLDSVNSFIALNGVHYAGTIMAEQIKQIRNPLFNPTYIFKKVIADRHQEKDDPKLTLYLAEHLHPSLQLPAQQLEYCVLRMRYACETLMARHGNKITEAYTELNRLAEAATNILVITAVLARASRSYCIGVRNAELEMKLSACFVENRKDKVKKLILEIEDGEYLNLDHFKIDFGKKVLDSKSLIVEKPTTRVYW